jgi:hypothetical protein
MATKVFLVSPEAPAEQGAAPAEQRAIKSGGIRLGTLDNAKGNADHLLGFLVEGVKRLLPVASVVTLRKPNPTTPAKPEVLDQLAAEADFVITAMAD